MVFGWAHGLGWILMSLLCIDAVRRRVIPLWLGVMVADHRRRRPVRRQIGFVYRGTSTAYSPRDAIRSDCGSNGDKRDDGGSRHAGDG